MEICSVEFEIVGDADFQNILRQVVAGERPCIDKEKYIIPVESIVSVAKREHRVATAASPLAFPRKETWVIVYRK